MNVHAKLYLAGLVAALAAGCGGGGADPAVVDLAASTTAVAAVDTQSTPAVSETASAEAEVAGVPSDDEPVFEDSPIVAVAGVEEEPETESRAMALSANGAATIDAAGDALENFESAFTTMPAKWSINWWGTKASYSVARESRSGFTHGGTGALRFQVGTLAAGSGVNLVYSYAFVKGVTYNASAYMRTDLANGARVEVQLRRSGKPYDVVARQQVTLGTTWQKASFQATYPFADAGALRVISLSPGANIYIDDVAVARTSTSTPVSDAVDLPAVGGSHVDITPVKSSPMDEAFATYASGWTYNYWGGTKKAEFAASRETRSSHVYAGSASQKWQVINKYGGQVHLVAKHAFAKGKTYRAVVYLRSDVSQYVQVMMRRDVHPYDNFASKTVQIGTGWQKVEMEGTYLGDSDGSLRISLKNPSGTVWLDEAVISEVSRNDFAPHNSTATIPQTLFGMHVNKVGTHDKWPGMNTAIVRLWNTGTTWRELEPAKGAWTWANGSGRRLDLHVDYVAKHNPSAEILYTLGQTPLWASTTPTVDGKYGMGASGAPKDMNDWRIYVRTLAQRYAGKIRYWEIWNEPDYPPHFNGSKPQLVEMTRIAREELLAADPSNKIVSPGMTKGQGMAYLDGYLAAGGGAYIDMVGYHWYYWLDPEMIGPMVDNLRSLMKTYGIQNKPIWSTEGAFWCDAAVTNCSTAVPTLAESRSVNARAMFTMAVKGVENFNFHVWEATDVVRRLVEADYTTQTEAGKAFGEARTWASGARIADSFMGGDHVHVLRLNRGAVDTYVLWSTKPDVTVNVPVQWNVQTVRTLSKAETPFPTSRQITLGLEPVLLKP